MDKLIISITNKDGEIDRHMVISFKQYDNEKYNTKALDQHTRRVLLADVILEHLEHKFELEEIC